MLGFVAQQPRRGLLSAQKGIEMKLFKRERSRVFITLAWLCALLVLGCLAMAAAMGLQLLPSSSIHLVGLVVAVGLLLVAGLLFLLEGFAAKHSATVLHAPEMSTLTFPPPSVSPRRNTVVPFTKRNVLLQQAQHNP